MIVVDTNVLSELCRERPDREVLRWYSAQRASDLFTTTITRGEMVYGVLIKAPGKKRNLLEKQVNDILQISFEGRQLPFNETAADAYAALRANAKSLGRPVQVPDAMIAAIAWVYGADVATRNVGDFEALGIGIINPFDSTGDQCHEDNSPTTAAIQDGRGNSVRDGASSPTYQYRMN